MSGIRAQTIPKTMEVKPRNPAKELRCLLWRRPRDLGTVCYRQRPHVTESESSQILTDIRPQDIAPPYAKDRSQICSSE